MTTLVTGANGFIGSAVTRQLLAAGHRVRVLVRPGSSRRNLTSLPVQVAEGDLTDPRTLRSALVGCRYLFHTAADYRLWVPDPEPMFRSNVEGTRNIMRAARKEDVERVVYTSSVATLEPGDESSPGDEGAPAAPEDQIGPYKRSKFLAEAEVFRQIREKGLPAVVVHPSTPIGPGDARPTPTGRMVLDAAAGRMPAFVDTGLNLVHVDDVAAGEVSTLDRGRIGESYILGGENYTLRRMLAEIASLTGRRPPRIRLPHSVVLPIAYAATAWAQVSGREPLATVTGVKLSRKPMFFTSAKAERELGYRPRPALEGLEDALQWFREQGYIPGGDFEPPRGSESGIPAPREQEGKPRETHLRNP